MRISSDDVHTIIWAMRKGLEALREIADGEGDVDWDAPENASFKRIHDSFQGQIENGQQVFDMLQLIHYSNADLVAQTDCEDCDGKGYIYSNDEAGNDVIQRCDECEMFGNDEEARNFVLRY